MLPLHLPVRITTGTQVRTATVVITKPFENVTVKYIKSSNSLVILFCHLVLQVCTSFAKVEFVRINKRTFIVYYILHNDVVTRWDKAKK